jgi:hypothetical protein
MVANIREKIDEIKQKLADNQKRVGLGNIELKNCADKYLNLSQEDLRKLSNEELHETAASIYAVATYIQFDVNKQNAIANWCQKCLTYLLAKQFNQIGGQYTPLDIRRQMFVASDEAAMELNKMASDIQLYLDEMHEIPWNLKAFAGSLEKLAASKK